MTHCRYSLLQKRSDEISEKEDTSHSGDERQTESPASLPPDSEENTNEPIIPHLVEAEAVIKNLEERRKSSLDHHWAVPNKLRSLDCDGSAVDEGRKLRLENVNEALSGLPNFVYFVL
jgi:hypothetical protein